VGFEFSFVENPLKRASYFVHFAHAAPSYCFPLNNPLFTPKAKNSQQIHKWTAKEYLAGL